jgi:hypothetical protein
MKAVQKHLKINLIEAERWQNELIEALEATQPVYFYRVSEELERLFGVVEYDPYAGSGLPDFIICNRKPTDAELRNELEELVENSSPETEQAA